MKTQNVGTKDIPLKLSRKISELALNSWNSGEMMSVVSLTTQELLKFWFCEPYTDNRNLNFHEGQKQSILNTIYLQEVLKIKNVLDIYEQIDTELLLSIDSGQLKKEKYNFPKYCIKMATGTGKTWVMHALLIWQYLNAKYEDNNKFSKNFLIVAPGVIVYERLLGAFLGKENEKNQRDFSRSDFYLYQDLLIPNHFKEDIFSFIQNSVAKKEEISNKVTGEGIIAITNWHLFLDREKEDEENVMGEDNYKKIIKNILPIRPGISGGNDLNMLDNNYLKGKEIEYLKNLDNLLIFNDEAHHIHEFTKYGEVDEVEWQKSLNEISKKKNNFIQIDFSATPYDSEGNGDKRVLHYFPYIISDFGLEKAIKQGLVKTIAIDKRKEIVELNLEFKAIRNEENKVIGLSDGQKLMIRAGMKKIKILEDNFIKFSGVSSNKYPKMMIMCEDTNVAPHVETFLREEGYEEKDIIKIDSNAKGEVTQDEWKEIKQKLFNIDNYDKPKIIICVLMLREGFDVNNICVIVPLRSSEAPILLEQTIGRGLRLMWREPEYEEIKLENRNRLLKEKKEPENYLDILNIIEHPAFQKFYDDLLKEDLAIESTNDVDGGKVLGDLINVELKEDYKKYDLYWPVIINNREEELKDMDFNINKLVAFESFTLDQLLKYVGDKDGEEFYSQEILVKTRFGDYMVNSNLFNAISYNEYIGKIINVIANRSEKINQKTYRRFPTIQINQSYVAQIIDEYIKNRLFGQKFDPFVKNNWKVLLLRNGIVTQHIIKEIGKLVFDMQNSVNIKEAEYRRIYFSEIKEMKIRENYSLNIVKSIYPQLKYPSNKGGFEKDFMEFIDNDSEVDSFIKIDENYHNFAKIWYIRNDGLIASYHPDFLIKFNHKIYLIETKAERDIQDINVKQKQLSTVEWINKINDLNLKDEMTGDWAYIILSENQFYQLKDNGASVREILELAKINIANIKGTLI